MFYKRHTHTHLLANRHTSKPLATWLAHMRGWLYNKLVILNITIDAPTIEPVRLTCLLQCNANSLNI